MANTIYTCSDGSALNLNEVAGVAWIGREMKPGEPMLTRWNVVMCSGAVVQVSDKGESLRDVWVEVQS